MKELTDTIPRTTIADLLFALRILSKGHHPVTLEGLRKHFCVNRRARIAGNGLWSAAVANVHALGRLKLVETSVTIRNKAAFERAKETYIEVSDEGRRVARLLDENRASAFDEMFTCMYRHHAYLRAFVSALAKGVVFVPVVTSLREHVAKRYSSAAFLVQDLQSGSFAFDEFLANVRERMFSAGRVVTSEQESAIRSRLEALTMAIDAPPTPEQRTDFAKSFAARLNDIILPILLEDYGLKFDYKTHKVLWGFGQEWKLWQSTTDHPLFFGRVVFRTGTVKAQGDQVEEIAFDRGIAATRPDFLKKLHESYTKLQDRGGGTFAHASQIRAFFCHENLCQETVFDKLLEEHSGGSSEYSVTLEMARLRSPHERHVRVGRRNVGLIRVVRVRSASA